MYGFPFYSENVAQPWEYREIILQVVWCHSTCEIILPLPAVKYVWNILKYYFKVLRVGQNIFLYIYESRNYLTKIFWELFTVFK